MKAAPEETSLFVTIPQKAAYPQRRRRYTGKPRGLNHRPANQLFEHSEGRFRGILHGANWQIKGLFEGELPRNRGMRYRVGEASPGGAWRNRQFGLRNFRLITIVGLHPSWIPNMKWSYMVRRPFTMRIF